MNCEIRQRHIKVGFKKGEQILDVRFAPRCTCLLAGYTEPLRQAELSEPVDIDDSTWTIGTLRSRLERTMPLLTVRLQRTRPTRPPARLSSSTSAR